MIKACLLLTLRAFFQADSAVDTDDKAQPDPERTCRF